MGKKCQFKKGPWANLTCYTLTRSEVGKRGKRVQSEPHNFQYRFMSPWNHTFSDFEFHAFLGTPVGWEYLFLLVSQVNFTTGNEGEEVKSFSPALTTS